MTRRTLQFVVAGSRVDGMLEIGAPAAVSSLEGHVERAGPLYLINDARPTYSPVDLIERGGIPKLGRFIPLGNYDAFGPDAIPDSSLDLVTNFIGFHHCPEAQLEGFVGSIHRALRPGGRLLLRDHDVEGVDQAALVGLAHDVFNAGFGLSWQTNAEQVRLFRSLDEWSAYLEGAGFAPSPRRLAQPHDPTRNRSSVVKT
jgi:SAM-dependent methyltransferase